MDVHAGIGGERVLRRVIALLVAFAVLAERAGARSPWVRGFVLWILRRAETAAAEFVFAVAGMPPPALDGGPTDGDGADEALCLARHFHALAAALCALLPLGPPFDRPARRGFALGQVAPCSGLLSGGWTREPNDTS